MNEPKTLTEKIAKLPAWAREHIETLQRERNVAVRRLTDYLDHQTKSPIYVEDYLAPCIGELRPASARFYVQGTGITMEAHGIIVRLSCKYGNTNDESIVLQWEDCGRRCRDVAMIPLSSHQVRLITKEKMR